jgi:large subunit ribosomal protein L5
MNKHTPIEEKILEAQKMFGKEFGVENVMALPKIHKIVVNMGTGMDLRDKGLKEKAVQEFSAITGQKPKIQNARISVAGFNLRAGMPVGLTVTLRGARMRSFLDKLISVVLPRLRDFRGIPTRGFDGMGNYTLGMTEHVVFPEIDLAKVDKMRGLEMTIVTKAGSPEKGRKFLEFVGMPFEKEEN